MRKINKATLTIKEVGNAIEVSAQFSPIRDGSHVAVNSLVVEALFFVKRKMDSWGKEQDNSKEEQGND